MELYNYTKFLKLIICECEVIFARAPCLADAAATIQSNRIVETFQNAGFDVKISDQLQDIVAHLESGLPVLILSKVKEATFKSFDQTGTQVTEWTSLYPTGNQPQLAEGAHYVVAVSLMKYKVSVLLGFKKTRYDVLIFDSGSGEFSIWNLKDLGKEAAAFLVSPKS